MATDNIDAPGDEFVEIDLGALDDEQLVEFEANLVAAYSDIRNAEDFSAGDEDAMSELREITEATKAVRVELAARVALSEMDDFAADLSGEDFMAHKMAKKDNMVNDGDEDDFAADDVAPIADETSAAATPEVKIVPTGLKSDVAPTASKGSGITASADIRGFRAGQELEGLSGVAAAMMAKRPDVRGTDKGNDGHRFLVASVAGEYDPARVLGNDLDGNMAKIGDVTSVSAITASGGFCAPITPYYNLTTYGDACRPVRDSLPVFKAERGGIRYMPAPQLADLTGSVRKTTAAQDAAGYTTQTPAGPTAPKPCLHVTCEAEQTCIIDAFTRCITFGNMGARTYPEQVEAWLKLGLAEFARQTEIDLLNRIAAASTALSATQAYGATHSLLEQVAIAVASFRSKHRLCSNARLRALLPWWLMEVLRSDLAAQAPGDGLGRFAVSDAQINDWFSVRGINITWYQDHTTAAGAPFSNLTGPTLGEFPNSVEWFLFPEGAFLYLDGGSLDLGLVRDSALNSVNDYQVFYEEFFGLCFIGQDALKITSTLCANGTYAPAGTLRTCP